MKNLLSVRNLSLSFIKKSLSKHHSQVEIKAINNISFDVKEGECLAIVGESGCGKSASLLSILKLHSHSVKTAGEIIFKEEDLQPYTEKQMRAIRGKKIALISQDPMSALNPTMKIAEQIAEALPIRSSDTKQNKFNRVVELLQETGINDAKKRSQQYPFEFSGGMLQRVAIAMALAGEPDLMMADEPTTALDVTLQKQVLNLIKKLQIKKNMALILVSHDLAVVSEMADSVLVMYAGEIVETADVNGLFKNPSHPYTQALLAALPKFDTAQKTKTLTAIPGQPPDLSLPIKGCAFAGRCPKAMRICVKEKPLLHKINEQHQVQCWLYHHDYLHQQDVTKC